jgi:hypothetical protein
MDMAMESNPFILLKNTFYCGFSSKPCLIPMNSTVVSYRGFAEDDQMVYFPHGKSMNIHHLGESIK